jgi:uncharacterized SAM-binding protein YcdF (DUF218 family)
MVWLIYPLSLALMLLILAYGAALLRKKTSFHILFLVGLLMLYLCSIEPVSDSLLRPLERKYPPPDRSQLKADAIVVLAGDIRKRVFPRTDIEVDGNRVVKAVRLFRWEAAPVIIMAGGSGGLFDQGYKEAEHMKDLAAEFGVPRSRIITETESRNTRENVVNTKRILDKIKAKRVILVTSAFHLPRSYALFKRNGIETIPVAADFYVIDEKYNLFSYVPTIQSLGHSSLAIKEYVGFLVYWVIGWL